MIRRPCVCFVMSVLLSGLLLGCGDLAAPPVSTGSSVAPPVVSFDPPALGDSTGVAPVSHLLVSGSELPDDLTLIRGRVGNKTMQQLQDGVLSESVRERLVPILWAPVEQRQLLVAPLRTLAEGDVYTIASPSRGWTSSFHTMDSDRVPSMSLLWPPREVGSGGDFAVWCLPGGVRGRGDAFSFRVELSPGQVGGEMRAGSLAGVGRGCVHWQLTDEPKEYAVVAPPLITLPDGAVFRLEPVALQMTPDRSSDSGSMTTGSCSSLDFVSVGRVCLKPMDDRVWVTAAEGVSLVSLVSESDAVTGVVDEEHALVLRGLPPSSRVSLRVTVLGPDSSRTSELVSIRTKPVAAHVVINEVLADAVGPEPCQEWVELFNDGASAVDLAGWTLQDSGGGTVLPSADLVSGGYALVVNDCFDAGSWVDTPPAPETLVVRVEHLGKSGLSNSGEALRLLDPAGTPRSAVPAIKPKRAGWSVARRSASEPSDAPSAFGIGRDGGTPGAPNGFEVSP